MINPTNKYKFRSGALGALMDEYERAADDLKDIIEKTSQKNFEKIIDNSTSDEECRSIKSIINHVVAAGYRYANQIRIMLGIKPYIPEYKIETPLEAIRGIDKVLILTANSVEGKWNLTSEEINETLQETKWGFYNIEMMFEHAIVHILRHRRQIEKFLLLIEHDEKKTH